MSDRSDRLDEILIRALAGDEDVAEVLKREGLDSSPECAERLREIRALCGDLDDLGAIERSDVEELASDASGASRETLFAGSRRGPLMAAAAAVLALISIAVWQFASDPVGPVGPGGEGVVMGPEKLSGLESDGYRSFRWKSTLTPTTKYEVRVFGAEGDEPITTSQPIRGNEWTPSPEESDKWPEEIRWEVHVVQPGSDASEYSASSFASRSS